MEFKFDVNDVFKGPVVEINQNLIPPGFKGDRRQLWETVNKVSEVVNAMGEASASAQGLSKPITTAEKLRNSDQTVYLLVDDKAHDGKGAVTGMLKTGKKGLYVFDRNGQHYQVSPPCVLDFYIHESKQRQGLGKKLFEHMLEKEKVEPVKMAIDRPSDKLLGFFNKHYGLQSPVKQMNNFVVFDEFFPSRQAKEDDDSNRAISSRTRGANGLQSSPASSSPYGRYGAPRPPCSMGQIIHNQTSVLSRASEPAGPIPVHATVSAPAAGGYYVQTPPVQISNPPSNHQNVIRQEIVELVDPNFCEYPPRQKPGQVQSNSSNPDPNTLNQQNINHPSGAQMENNQYYNNQQNPGATNIQEQTMQYQQSAQQIMQDPNHIQQQNQRFHQLPDVNYQQQVVTDPNQLTVQPGYQQLNTTTGQQVVMNQTVPQQQYQANNQQLSNQNCPYPPITPETTLQQDTSIISPKPIYTNQVEDYQRYQQQAVLPNNSVPHGYEQQGQNEADIQTQNRQPTTHHNPNQLVHPPETVDTTQVYGLSQNPYYGQPVTNSNQYIQNHVTEINSQLNNSIVQEATQQNVHKYVPRNAFGLQEPDPRLQNYLENKNLNREKTNVKMSGLQDVETMEQIYEQQDLTPQRNAFTMHHPQRFDTSHSEGHAIKQRGGGENYIHQNVIVQPIGENVTQQEYIHQLQTQQQLQKQLQEQPNPALDKQQFQTPHQQPLEQTQQFQYQQPQIISHVQQLQQPSQHQLQQSQSLQDQQQIIQQEPQTPQMQQLQQELKVTNTSPLQQQHVEQLQQQELQRVQHLQQQEELQQFQELQKRQQHQQQQQLQQAQQMQQAQQLQQQQSTELQQQQQLQQLQQPQELQQRQHLQHTQQIQQQQAMELQQRQLQEMQHQQQTMGLQEQQLQDMQHQQRMQQANQMQPQQLQHLQQLSPTQQMQRPEHLQQQLPQLKELQPGQQIPQSQQLQPQQQPILPTPMNQQVQGSQRQQQLNQQEMQYQQIQQGNQQEPEQTQNYLQHELQNQQLQYEQQLRQQQAQQHIFDQQQLQQQQQLQEQQQLHQHQQLQQQFQQQQQQLEQQQQQQQHFQQQQQQLEQQQFQPHQQQQHQQHFQQQQQQLEQQQQFQPHQQQQQQQKLQQLHQQQLIQQQQLYQPQLHQQPSQLPQLQQQQPNATHMQPHPNHVPQQEQTVSQNYISQHQMSPPLHQTVSQPTTHLNAAGFTNNAATTLRPSQSTPQPFGKQNQMNNHQKVTLHGEPESARYTQSSPDFSQKRQNEFIPVIQYQQQQGTTNSSRILLQNQEGHRNGLDDMSTKRSFVRNPRPNTGSKTQLPSQNQQNPNQPSATIQVTQPTSIVHQQYQPQTVLQPPQMQPIPQAQNTLQKPQIQNVQVEKLGRNEFIAVNDQSIFRRDSAKRYIKPTTITKGISEFLTRAKFDNMMKRSAAAGDMQTPIRKGSLAPRRVK